MTLREITRFESRDLFKLLMVGYSGITIPVSIVSGILALFEIVPATLNQQKYVGIKGFVIAILTAPIYILLMAIATWLFLAIGLWLANFGVRIFKQS